MNTNIINSADSIGLFCRLHMNSKRDLPIRSSEMGVLIFTHKQNTSVTPLMISKFFSISKPSVTSMLKSLIKSGYLLKEASDVDKRSYTISISEKGKSLVESTFIDYFKSIELLKEKMGQGKFDQFIELIQFANSILKEVK